MNDEWLKKRARRYAETWAEGQPDDSVLSSHTVGNVREAVAKAFEDGVVHGATGQYLIDPDQDERFRMTPEDAARADQFHSGRLWAAQALGVPYERIAVRFVPTAEQADDIGAYWLPKPLNAGQMVFYVKPEPPPRPA